MDTNEMLSLILQEIRELKAGQKNLEAGYKSLEAGYKSLEAGQKNLEAEYKSLVAGQKNLEAAYKSLETDVAETKEDARHTRMLVEAQDCKIQLLCEAQAEATAKFRQLDRMEQTLNEVKSEVEVIRDVVRFHSADIANLKKAL